MRWSEKDNSLICRPAAKLATFIVTNGARKLGNAFIRYRNGNKFDLRRTNLELIEKNRFCIDPNNSEITLLYIQSSVKMTEPVIAKLDTIYTNEVSKNLWYISSDNYVTSYDKKTVSIKRLHRIIFELAGGTLNQELVIDHIDRDRFNNCSSNLRQVTSAINNYNCNIKCKTNSGVVGVFEYNNNWVATVPNCNIPSKNKLYYFNITTYGYEIAKQLAIEKRKEWEIKLGITSVLVD